MSNVCSIVDCGTPVGRKGARGMCPRHYGRLLRVGAAQRLCESCGVEVSATRRFCSDKCKPRCAIADCGQPVRKSGWCASHYAQAQRSGQPPQPFGYKWASRQSECAVCGAPTAPGFRLYCSGACSLASRMHGGARPKEAACVACGVAIDLTERTREGQLRKASIKFCRPCKQDYNKYKMSAREIAQRDGNACGICAEPVDLSMSRADGLMCPSVDHVVPRAHGGTHDPENLQLTHLRCNMAKSDRVAVSSAPGGD